MRGSRAGGSYRFFTDRTLPTFRAAAACIVPGDARSPGADSEGALAIADAVLAERPARDRRLLHVFLRLLELLPLLRYGRRFTRLRPEQRAGFLSFLENTRWFAKLRQGFFGVKTFALLGHYGSVGTFKELGYPGPRLDAPYYRREAERV